ncbi:flagellin N-terminal helical domain-containing protein [Arthrobacter sp. H16F315]|uniref:flagellin N-terminal helical domain-containing protein n=1 Tax=Arthrobacter sp. H16F315 TaxID=2955314 RepID=UPI002097ED1D|nr:flagellin [Arthrobacter sp. H16F315]MDD1475667.1 flagellin [Arthrobacter sp. H16F315]
MGMQINTNLAANNAYRSLSNTQMDLSKSLEKLSSGLRINRAGDDAAGLALSEGLKSQIGGLSVAARNAQDGIGAVQTAEGGLNQTQSILQRLRDLGVQAANDTNNAESRGAIKTEANSLVKELDRIAGSTNFNGTQLLNSSKTLSFQVGANADTASQIDVNLSGANVKTIANTLAGGDLTTTGSSFAIADVTTLTTGAATFESTAGGVKSTVTTGVLADTADASATGFQSVEEYATALRSDSNFSSNFTVSVTKDANGAGTGLVVTALNGGTVSTTAAPATGLATGGSTGTAVTGGLKFDTAANAQASIKMLDTQITKVSTARAELGASQNRLESAVQTINVAKENLTASNSRIRDTDMAEEMVKFTRNNILSQAGTAMLAQANQSNQGVLQLLR